MPALVDVLDNRILHKLTRKDYQALCPKLELVSLYEGEILCLAGGRFRHIYFPNDAIVSQMVRFDDHRWVEVAMEGNESAVGFPAYLSNVRSRNLSVVRSAGHALRIRTNLFTQFAIQLEILQNALNRYTYALTSQIEQSGVCNQFHNIDSRLARWLLMTQDRAGKQDLHTTQESIAKLLGVRRSSINRAACRFREDNLIDYSRGHLVILDKGKLIAASCSCYGIIKRQYDSFLN